MSDLQELAVCAAALRAVSAAARAAPAADFVVFRQAGLGGIKEGREAAAVAELRRDTASLLIRL
jgi:hypothetical protein